MMLFALHIRHSRCGNPAALSTTIETGVAMDQEAEKIYARLAAMDRESRMAHLASEATRRLK